MQGTREEGRGEGEGGGRGGGEEGGGRGEGGEGGGSGGGREGRGGGREGNVCKEAIMSFWQNRKVSQHCFTCRTKLTAMCSLDCTG